jgi:hypothetical protein
MLELHHVLTTAAWADLDLALCDVGGRAPSVVESR